MTRVLFVLMSLALSLPTAAQEVVAARSLRPGDQIGMGDLRPGPDGDAAAVARFKGLEVRHAVYEGRSVTAADLGPPTLVRRNAPVRLLFRDGRLGIRTEGRALDAGGAGERVRVMNLSSRQTVTGIVTVDGSVEIHR